LNLLFLSLWVGLLALGFAWVGRKSAKKRPELNGVSPVTGFGLLLGFGLASWSLGFSAAFVVPPLLLGIHPSFKEGQPARWWNQLGVVVLAGWMLFAVYPFGEFALDRQFLGYFVLLLVYLFQNIKLFSKPVAVSGYQVGVIAVGLLLVSYFAFEERRAFPVVWLPLLLAWGLLCVLPFAIKGLVFGRQIGAVLGLVAGVLVLKVTNNVAEFIALGICFFPLYMDWPAQRFLSNAHRTFSLAEFWVVERKWEAKLVSGGFWVVQFMVGLFALQGTSFGYTGMAVFLALLFIGVFALTRRETRLMAKLSLPVPTTDSNFPGI